MIFKQYFRVTGMQLQEGGSHTVQLQADRGILRPLIGHAHRLKDSDPMGTLLLDVESVGAKQDLKLGEIFMVTLQHAPGISQGAYISEQEAEQRRTRQADEDKARAPLDNSNGVGHD